RTRAREACAAPAARGWSAAASEWISTSLWNSARSTRASCSPASRIRPPRQSCSTSTSDAGPTRRRGSHDRGQPARIAVVLAFADAKVQLLQLGGDRAGGPGADGALIDLDHRRDLRAGAAEEHLIGDVQLAAVDGALDDLDAELVACEGHEHRSGDAFDDVLRHRRRDELTVP